MLHSGHVAFFKEASALGDLYVGIGSDATILELKNRKTVNAEQERLYMVKAIRYVKDAFINSGSGIMDFAAENFLGTGYPLQMGGSAEYLPFYRGGIFVAYKW